MKKAFIITVIWYVIIITLVFTFVRCSPAKIVPNCMTYSNSYPIEQPKKFSKFLGKSPIKVKNIK